MPGRGFSMVIDSHCVLDANGDFSFWSKSRNSLHDSDSEREPGTWEAHDGELRLRFRSGTTWSKAYIVGAHMLWPKDRRYGVWERIR